MLAEIRKSNSLTLITALSCLFAVSFLFVNVSNGGPLPEAYRLAWSANKDNWLGAVTGNFLFDDAFSFSKTILELLGLAVIVKALEKSKPSFGKINALFWMALPSLAISAVFIKFYQHLNALNPETNLYGIGPAIVVFYLFGFLVAVGRKQFYKQLKENRGGPLLLAAIPLLADFAYNGWIGWQILDAKIQIMTITAEMPVLTPLASMFCGYFAGLHYE